LVCSNIKYNFQNGKLVLVIQIVLFFYYLSVKKTFFGPNKKLKIVFKKLEISDKKNWECDIIGRSVGLQHTKNFFIDGLTELLL
jgi:DNA-directed RNA polymerase beta' subunit